MILGKRLRDLSGYIDPPPTLIQVDILEIMMHEDFGSHGVFLSILDIPNFIVLAKMRTNRHRPLPAVRRCTQRGGCMSEVRVPQEVVAVTPCG